jgi:ribosomal protein S18 acetylase RimI-like enzyme
MFNLVFESNPARRLYERLGFEVVGRVPEAFEGEDAIIYWRTIHLEDASGHGSYNRLEVD